MKFFDTSFLIDILRKKSDLKDLILSLDEEGPHCTNTIVVHEFFVGGLGSKNSNAELKVRKDLIHKLIVFPFDIKSAEESSKIENKLRISGELIGTADILIAGTMIANDIDTILTRNYKHFEKIKGITVQIY